MVTDADNSTVNGTANGTANSHPKIAVDAKKAGLSPNAAQDASALVSRLSTLGESVALDDRKQRTQMLEAAEALTRVLETPRETVLRYCWSQVGVSPLYFFLLSHALCGCGLHAD